MALKELITSSAGNSIDAALLEELEQKLIASFDTTKNHSTFAEWATFAHFTLNTDVTVGRALAQNLVQLIDTLKPAMPDASNSDLIVALSALAQFMNLGLIRGVEETGEEMALAWETFVSKVSYPEGNNRMGLDIDAGMQRWRTAIAMEVIQGEIFGNVIARYQEQTEIDE